MLAINKKYINYFDPDFLYRKIVEEKPNNGELNIFQKIFIDNVCNYVEKEKEFPDVVDSFVCPGPLRTLLKGWELWKFVC